MGLESEYYNINTMFTLGKGLFCNIDILPGITIAYFNGKKINIEEYNKLNNKEYCIRINKDLILDCFENVKDLTCYASFANSYVNAINKLNIKAIKNAKLSINTKTKNCKLVSNILIKKNTEIFYDYNPNRNEFIF